MKRKFISTNARGRGQSIVYFSEPFKLVPVSQIADIADPSKHESIHARSKRTKLRSDILRNNNVGPFLYRVSQIADWFSNSRNSISSGTSEHKSVYT